MTQRRRRSPFVASVLAIILLVAVLPPTTHAATATSVALTPAGTDSATYGDPATYSATLTEAGSGAPVGGASISFDATPSGGGTTVSLGNATTNTSGVATLGVNPVSVLGAGTWLISADWAGDETWGPSDSVATTLAVSQATLTITPAAKSVAYSSPPPAYTFGVTGWKLSETKSTADGYVDPTCSSPYTVTSPVGTQLTISCSGGSATNYAFDTTATATLTVTKANQTITFDTTAPTDAKVGGPHYTPIAIASSGLAVTFSIATHAVCALEVDGSVSLKNPGPCTINADQAGNGNWNVAPRATQSFVVTGATATATTVSSSANPSIYGAGVSFTATISPSAATGTVQFAVDGVNLGGTVSVVGGTATSGTISSLAAGTHTVLASFTSDDPVNYADSSGTLTGGQVVDKADQTITFTRPPDTTFDESPVTVSATASSGLTVTFSSLTTGVCTVAGTTVTFVATGDCTIRAAQSGNTNYKAAPNVDRTFAVGEGDQAITFAPLANRTFDLASITVSATASSGLPVTFSSQTTSICTTGGTHGVTVTFVTVGICTIRASQAGDADWNAATPVDRSFTISRGSQSVSFTSTAPTTAIVGGPTYTPTGTATSGLAVSFSIDAGAADVCTISAGVVSFTDVGTCVIDANQSGNANWNAATQTQQTFSVGGGSSTTTLASNHNPSVFGQPVTFSATVSGGGVTPTGTVTFRDGATVLGTGTLNGSGVATLTTSALSVATHSITAAYGGSASYTASTSSTLAQVVGKAGTTLGLASSDALSVYGQTVTFTATVSVTAPGAGTASGTVQFRVDGLDFGVPVAVAGGHATLVTSALVAGSHEIAAIYSGDGSFSGSSTTLAGGQTVAKATLAVTADPATREYGQANPVFSATISGFVNGESLPTSGVSGSPTCSSAATESSPVSGSPYAIACVAGSLTAANYGFTFVDGDLAVEPATSTVALVSDHNPAVPNQPVTLTATVTGLVTGLPTPGGSVEFQAWNGAAWTHLDTQALVTGFSAATSLTLPSAGGEHRYRAVFTSPDGNYSNGIGELVQSVGRSPVTVTITASRLTWETNVPLVFTAMITPDATSATVPVTGSVDFTVDGGAVQTVAVTNGAAALPAVKFTTAGIAHTITAAYRADATGSLSYQDGTASPLTATVATNVVNATGVGVSSSSIYPYRDTWRDTVDIRGTRSERLAVTITIYRPTGSRLLTKTITAGTGAYKYTWTGRYSSGTMLPAGRYRIVQTLTDVSSVPALRKSWTSYVSLSTRRMVWRTVTYYATPGPRHWQFGWAPTGSTVSASSSSSTSALVLSAPNGGWVGVGYQFTVPSASTYKSISFQVQGSWTGAVAPKIGLHDWTISTSWGGGAWSMARPRTSVGTSATTWYRQTQTSGTRYVRSRIVRGFIDTGGYFTGTLRYTVTRVRLVVTYGILQ